MSAHRAVTIRLEAERRNRGAIRGKGGRVGGRGRHFLGGTKLSLGLTLRNLDE